MSSHHNEKRNESLRRTSNDIYKALEDFVIRKHIGAISSVVEESLERTQVHGVRYLKLLNISQITAEKFQKFTLTLL